MSVSGSSPAKMAADTLDGCYFASNLVSGYNMKGVEKNRPQGNVMVEFSRASFTCDSAWPERSLTADLPSDK